MDFQLRSPFAPEGDQPETHVPSTNTSIVKGASVNDDVERLRLQMTSV